MRQHKTFGINTTLVESMRESIQQNLDTWRQSIRRHFPQQSCDSISTRARDGDVVDGLQERETSYPSDPKMLLYGWHLFHCFHILLYGKMDLIEMFSDTDWLLSRDFLITAEHAGHCAKGRVALVSRSNCSVGFYRRATEIKANRRNRSLLRYSCLTQNYICLSSYLGRTSYSRRSYF